MPPRTSARIAGRAQAPPKQAVDLTGLSSDNGDEDDDDGSKGAGARRAASNKGKQRQSARKKVVKQVDDALAESDEEGPTNAAGRGAGTRPELAAGDTPQPHRASAELGNVGAEDPRARLQPHKDLFVGETKCQNCRGPDASTSTVAAGEKTARKGGNKISPATITQLTEKTPLSAFLNATAAPCVRCGAPDVCRGCGLGFESGATSEDGNPREKGACCAEGRAIAVFTLLSALDNVYLADHLQRPATTEPPAKKKRTRQKAPPKGNGAGTGYGSGNSYAGVGGYGVNSSYGAAAGTGYAYDSYDEYDDYHDEALLDEFANEHGLHPEDYSDEDAFYEMLEDKYAEYLEAKGKAAAAVAKGKAANAKGKDKGKAAQTAEEKRDAAQDRVFASALRSLASLLPHPDSPTAHLFDFLAHDSLPSLLDLSTLPDLLATLLRNDSVSEWERRSEVYFAMLDVLGLLGGCEATLGCLFGERREKRWSEGIGRWMRGEGEVEWVFADDEGAGGVRDAKGKGKGKGKADKKGKKRQADELEELGKAEGKVVMAMPLYALLKKLLIQANAFRRAAASSSEFDDGDIALLGICGDFTAAGERLLATEKVWADRRQQEERAAVEPETSGGSGRKGKGKAKQQAKARAWTEQDYVRACAKLAYGAVELDSKKHHYAKEIQQSASSKRPHGSFVHLAKELAVLSTSLPQGIWIRHDEERVDVIKCLIAGPAHSPYAGGLFEFDLFLPLQYPQVSPQCWLVTTGDKTVRFNPNLYAEGKVCLSLLGTWSGSPEEMWQPGKSTILQCLLSICSMILGTNFPFYNEPGFGAPRDDERNKTYNKNISLATARWAMLDWIEGEKHKKSIWADVIASHFSLRRAQIVKTLQDWAKKDERLHAWVPRHNKVAGTHQLEPYGGGAYVQPWKEGGKLKSEQEVATERKKLLEAERKQARDLVKEIEAALDRVEGWKGPEWLGQLAA